MKKNLPFVAICLMLFVAALLMPQSNVLPVFGWGGAQQPYYGVKTDKPYIAIECNVYSGSEYLDSILNTLREKNVKITFCVGGIWAEKNGGYVLKMYQDGHEIGNHGYRHLMHGKISYEKNREEIEKTHQIIFELTGYHMDIFAPPSGDFSATTIKAAQDCGYKTFMWTADTIDWRDQDDELLLQRVYRKIDKGGVILIHPTAATARILPRMIDRLREQGYRFVTLGTLWQQTVDESPS